MAKKSKNCNRKNVSVAHASMFGAPSLLEGESLKDYSALLNQIRAAVKPTDVIEEMWVEDCASLFWDTLRLRRHKAELINANMYRGLQVVLETLCPQSEASDLTSQWSVRNKKAIETIEWLLDAGNLSMEAIKAQTLAEIIDKIERIDKMIAVSEARRSATLGQIDRRRGAFAHALRDATTKIEDAEFVELEAPQLEAETSELETEDAAADEEVPDEDGPAYLNSEAAE